MNGDINKFYQYSFPMQAVLVTCNDNIGKTNIITIAWHTPISKKPPLYAISVAPNRYSYDLIKNSKEFVVNFVPVDLVEKVHLCGIRSGRKTDKFDKCEFTILNSKKINTPGIKECYAHLECKLYETKELGDHFLFVGEVVNVSANKNAFDSALIRNDEIQPTYYIGGNKYTTIDKQRKEF